MEELGGHIVLDDLVLENAEASLLDRHTRQFRRRADPGAHHRLDDRVDLLLVELAEYSGRLGRHVDDGVNFVFATVVDRRRLDRGSGLGSRRSHDRVLNSGRDNVGHPE